MLITRMILTLLLIFSVTMGMSRPPEFTESEYAKRRTALLDELRTLNACAFLHSAPVQVRNDDVDFEYRQDSNLLYLTGWEHAYSLLLLTPQPEDSEEAEVTLFVMPRDIKHEIWTGPKEGLEEASAQQGVDQALSYKSLMDTLLYMSSGYDRWVYSHGNDRQFEQDLLQAKSEMRGAPPILQEAESLIKDQRLIKSAAEIKTLEKAIEITGASLVDAFKVIPTLQYEYEAQAEIEYGFMKRGAKQPGFPSIVGAGKNATYLHYEDNRGKLRKDELILLDVGAEWNYYTADISRTVPIDGKFTPEQKAIYQLVLKAQEDAIATIEPGVSWRIPHETAIRTVTKGLVELELLSGPVDTLIAHRGYRKFFMHGTSHWLGLDVHDAGGYSDGNKVVHKLQPGMVLTVEPGIYISESDDVDPRWWNIGVRIEDDILVTKRGNRVLSKDIPKSITEIEALMKQ